MAQVLTNVVEGVAVVTLHDPDRRNAINLELNAQLVATIDGLEDRDDVGAVVVTGAPPAFCAGADLEQLRTRAHRDGLAQIYAGFLRLAHCRLPTVAAVNGAAVGAGMNMALACDVILAGDSARFDPRFLQLGVHPGGGHTWRLRRLTDHQTVMAMVVFGEHLDGRGAAQHGLAWRCVPDDELLGAAVALGARAAAVPRRLARRTKATIGTLDEVATSEGAVDHELDAQIWSMDQPDFTERVARLQRRISGGDR